MKLFIIVLSLMLFGCGNGAGSQPPATPPPASPASPEAFRVGSNWVMTDQESRVTSWSVSGFPAKTTFGCYTSAQDNEFRDLYISKTDQAAYWAPGASQNVHVILRNSAWGLYIFELKIVDMANPKTVLKTVYYNSPAGMPADLIVGEAGTSYTTTYQHVYDDGNTERCVPQEEFQAATDWGYWTTVWTNENGILCALENEGALTPTGAPWDQERWCFDSKTLNMLELDALVQNNKANGLVLTTK